MNTLGSQFCFSSFGESHGPLVGVVVSGCPPGIPLTKSIIDNALEERRPGASDLVTQRKEEDKCEIASGVLAGKTTGAPICVTVQNRDVLSNDYAEITNKPRPGHADYPAFVKYGGYNDVRGGGRFSGRLTIAHVVAGVIARQILSPYNLDVTSRITQIGNETEDFEKIIRDVLNAKDSVGGIIKTTILGLPVGLGEPLFNPVESCIAHAMFTIPGIVGIEFGDGFKSALQRGSEHNDPYNIENNRVILKTNHCGGVLGGMTVGSPLEFSVVVKPTSSIGIPQQTVDLKTRKPTTLTIQGRHDPCIALRAVPVVKYTTWFVLVDLFMMGGLLSSSQPSKSR